MNDVSILVYSSDGYADIWKIFFRLLYKYWDYYNDRPKIYVATETQQLIYFGGVVPLNTTGAWTDRIRKAVEMIPTKYVIGMCEDFFLRKPVRHEIISQCIEYLEQDPNIACFNFEKDYLNQSVPSKYENFGLKVRGHCWQKSCQATLWNKEILIELLQGSMNPWEWEESEAPYKYQYYVWNGSVEDLVFDYGYYNGKWFGIRKGKWVKDDVVPLFQKEQIDVDYSIRGFYTGQTIL